MATYTKNLLSGSTNGKQIKVAATGTPGTTVHTAVAGTSGVDEIWLWAQNNHTAAVALTIEFGGTASPDDLIVVTLASKTGLQPILPGLLLNNGCVVKAFAGTTNVICLSGYVNSITA